jgi:hypothetical protein
MNAEQPTVISGAILSLAFSYIAPDQCMSSPALIYTPCWRLATIARSRQPLLFSGNIREPRWLAPS